MNDEILIELPALRVTAREGRDGSAARTLLDGVPFRVRAGERVAVVGESGSGKSTLLKALIGLHAANLEVEAPAAAGALLAVAPGARGVLRHDEVSFVPQDPGLSLNPALSIGAHLREAVAAGDPGARGDWRAAATELLGLVDLATTVPLSAMPRSLSGGQRQRVVIAIALAKARGRLILADEPTSALDPTVQQLVIDTLDRRSRERGLALVLVTHDLALALQHADRIVVLREGRIVAEIDAGPDGGGLAAVEDPYTRTLFGTVEPIDAILDARERRPAPDDDPVLVVDGVGKRYRRRTRRGAARPFELEPVSFTLHAGRTLALIGESGSGKTTLGRILVNLLEPSSGRVEALGVGYGAARSARSRRDIWSQVQIVTQDPNTSLDLRWSGRDVLLEPFRNFFPREDDEAFERRLARVLEQAGLDPARVARPARELSGGERQRLSIARALIVEPRILVLDEPLAALDGVTSLQVQRTLIELTRRGYALVYISHDIRSVARIADDVVLLEHGEVRDRGGVHDVLAASEVETTRALVRAVPAAVV